MATLSKKELILAQNNRPEGYLEDVLSFASEVKDDVIVLPDEKYGELKKKYKSLRENNNDLLKKQLRPIDVTQRKLKDNCDFDNYRLSKFRKRIYSENGEDGIIKELVKRLKWNYEDLWFCEVDDYGEDFCLNTFEASENGAALIYIESNPIKFRIINSETKNRSNVFVVGADISLSGAKSIDRILDSHSVNELHLISINAGDKGIRLLNSINSYKPVIAIIQYDKSNFDSVLREGVSLGYDAFIADGKSMFFIRDDLAYLIE